MINPLLSAQTFADTAITDRIVEWSIAIMERLGGPGAAFLIALENVFPPLPSEIILPLAGFTSSQGNMNLFAAIAWATLGSLAGALLLYQLGRWLGRERIRHYANKLPLVKLSDIDKAEKWFAKYENQAVLFGRMIPIVRSLISIPAGVEKMPIQIFVIYTLLGSLAWNSLLISAGYLLGEQWFLVERYVGFLQYAVITAVLAFVGYFVTSRLKRRNQRKSSSN